MLIDGKLLQAVSGKTFPSRTLPGRSRSGRGPDPLTDMGPLVSDEQISRVAGYTEAGRRSGAHVAVGGTAHKLASRIRSGTVWINCHTVFDASLPFGGSKQSGWGREMGAEVSHNYTEVKAVTAAL